MKKNTLRSHAGLTYNLLALVALGGCTGLDKDLGSTEAPLREDEGTQSEGNTETQTSANDGKTNDSDSEPGANDEQGSTEKPSAADDDETTPDEPQEATSSPATPEDADGTGKPAAANTDDRRGSASDDSADEATDDTEAAADDESDPDEATDDTEAAADDESDPDEEEPAGDNDDTTDDDEAASDDESAATDGGTSGPEPEFAPLPTPRGEMSLGLTEPEVCDLSEDTFDELMMSETAPADVLGVWVGSIPATALELPSGSGRITLTVTESWATVVFGEEVDTSLIPGPWPGYVGPREGFVYNLPMGEVSRNVIYEGEPYELTLPLRLSPNEPLEPHCQAREPKRIGDSQCFSCLPSELAGFTRVRTEDLQQQCIIDEQYEMSCSEFGLCWQDCLCDAEECHYQPYGFTSARLNAAGQLLLPIDFYWLLGHEFTPNAPNDALWAVLERQE